MAANIFSLLAEHNSQKMIKKCCALTLEKVVVRELFPSSLIAKQIHGEK